MLEEAGRCAYCGFCEAACPTLRHGPHRGYGPRGRVEIARRLLEGLSKPTGEAVASLFTCLLCGACRVKCPLDVDVPLVVRGARSLYLAGVLGGRVGARPRLRG